MGPHLRSVLLLLWIVAAAPPKDPWDQKYSEWDFKVVGKVLTDSPWTKKVRTGTIGAAKGLSEFEGVNARGLTADQEENQRIADFSQGAPFTRPEDAVQQDPIKHKPLLGTMGPGPVNQFVYVRWLSAVTVREAVARYWVLQGRADPRAVESLINYEPEQYAIGLGPLSIPANTPEEARTAVKNLIQHLRESATIRVDDGPEVPAMHVEVPQGKSLTPAAAVIIYFPKLYRSAPVLAGQAKKIRFRCNLDHYRFSMNTMTLKLAPMVLDVGFELARMNRAGKPDL